ncbi:hypothetical protein EXT68_19660 [Pectobacterium parmentieri]|uniref:Uncharacterized protein n=1 Tax=Pectobacterium parmentieri TaxID=1905730 RepID=A0A0H3HZ45_PECPM|nr:hypothetical protein [Pectobacterium parmentieri]AFI89106.1 Hypothetical protein W5S_0988 [Pectobacterium parmentieri]MBI0470211.1 hypothetical protein [Pectobacterium parmentieri]MBI0492811.1 hypothetical protein [Pectobacterium parmentieri]MBI0553674.1 hypothetical protein [Pectobacterium parmentieri]MBI0567088.1 hypothetical protein [Pectobacterium parmentieri]
MKKNELVNVLRARFPLFANTNDDDDVYLLYGSFGSFFIDLINLRFFNRCDIRYYFYSDVELIYKDVSLLDEEIKKIYYFIDELYLIFDSEIADVLNTCIFEAIMDSDFSYDLARKYLSKEAYNHYVEITK